MFHEKEEEANRTCGNSELTVSGGLLETAEAPGAGDLSREPKIVTPAQKEAALALWRKNLSGIPSLLGRLDYVSSRRQQDGSGYKHYGLALVLGDEEAGRALRESHEELFSEWLLLSLREKKADLESYIMTSPGHRRQVLQRWESRYADFIPERSREPERELYLCDMKALVEVMKNEYARSSSTSKSTLTDELAT